MSPSYTQAIVAVLSLCWFMPAFSGRVFRGIKSVLPGFTHVHAAALDFLLALLTGLLIREWWALLIPLIAMLPAVPKVWRDEDEELSPISKVVGVYSMVVVFAVLPIAIGISAARTF